MNLTHTETSGQRKLRLCDFI